MEVSKNDWKLFRARIGDWQEAYMGRLTKDYIDLLSEMKMLQINSGSWKITIINTMSLAGSWTNARKRKQYSLNVNYHRKTLQIR